MRRTRDMKAETHKTILAQAARLFRERGVEGTSVSDVMTQAGLTHGGFYRHFENKDALVAATIRAIFDEIAAGLKEHAAVVGTQAATKDYLANYLSSEHVAHPGLGCPVPSLGGEIGRAPEPIRTEFGASFNRTLATLAQGYSGSDEARRSAAMRELAMHIGAVVIARASDPATAKDVLEICREPAGAISHKG